MSKLGGFVLVLGIILGIVAFSMDTTVTTEPQSIAGVSIPSQTVNNIGLMDERRNYLTVSGLLVLVGVGLVTASTFQKSTTDTSVRQAISDTRKCPYCAEDIKSEAIVCRYCGRELESDTSKQSATLNAKYKEAQGEYAKWLTAVKTEDAFFQADDAAALLKDFVASFGRVVDACEGERSGLRSAIARHAARDFSELVDNPGLSSAITRLTEAPSALAGERPAELPTAQVRGRFLVCPVCNKMNPLGAEQCQWCQARYTSA
jgi:hypothetical protein